MSVETAVQFLQEIRAEEGSPSAEFIGPVAIQVPLFTRSGDALNKIPVAIRIAAVHKMIGTRFIE